MMRFETFQRRNLLGQNRAYFRIVAANNEILAQSQAYRNVFDRNHAIKLIKSAAKTAATIEGKRK